MTEETRKNIEQNMNDQFDRAEACPCDSDDYFTYEKQAEGFGKLLIEEEKNRLNYQLEMKKLELEQEKLRYANSWKNPVNWVPWVIGGIGTGVPIVIAFVNKYTLREHRRETMSWEGDGNMFTTIAGRSNSGAFGQYLKGGK